jgi:alpha-galactosidase
VEATLAPEGFTVALRAGERWTSPVVFSGVYAGDLDAAAASQHDYHRAVLSPPLPDDFPWVQANTWFSYLCDYDQEVLAREVTIARELGVEIFYVDAGWWVGNPRHEDLFASGLGDWRENRDKFPDGLRAFADLVRSHGMRFGIWVEPERVDLRTATTGSWQTGWLVRQEGGFRGPDSPQDTDTAWLCFGHPATQAWAESWIGDLVESLGVAWLKWDSNFWAVCSAQDHGHDIGDGEAAQLAGVHRVMDALRQRFPDLIIENCAGGGTRMDFEMARHSHIAWVNDASEPAHRVSFHLEGASYLFPPAVLNSWVTESGHENLNGRDLPEPVLTAIVRSRMMGALGFSCRTVEWSAETRRIVAAAVAEYTSFRHLLKDGYVSHLLPQATLMSPQLKTPAVWEAIQFRARDASEAVVLAFRNISPEETIVLRPRGLDHEASYDVAGDDGATSRMTGAALATQGLRPCLAPLTSARYHFRRVEGGAA